MKTKLMTMLLAAGAALGARAVMVPIGSGNDVYFYFPLLNTYKYSLTQQIYTAAEIGTPGRIVSIAFKNDSNGQLIARDIDIYLVHTAESKFDSATDWIPVTAANRVFSGSVTFAVGEWTEIVLDGNFYYDGESNLAVVVHDHTGSWTSSTKFYTFGTAAAMSIRAGRDGPAYDPTNPGVTGTIMNYKNQVQFEIDPPISIGSGGSSNNGIPTTSLYEYSLSQQIYTSEEIGTAGDIYNIAFRNTGTATLTRNMDIYLVHTSKNSFSGATDWIPVTGSDLAFSGNVTFLADGWTTITLDTPFFYNGVDSLVVVVDDNTGSDDSALLSCRDFESLGQTLWVCSAGTNYDPFAPGSYIGGMMNAKNLIRLGMDKYPYVVVQIGTGGTGTSASLPADSSRKYSLTEQIYTAEEMRHKAGGIEGIAFMNRGIPLTRNIDIYLAHTTKNSFDSSTDGIPVTAANKVFSGNIDFSNSGWTSILFNRPFVYNGTDNLAVIVDDNSSGWDGNMEFDINACSGNAAIYDASDDADFDPTAPGVGGNPIGFRNVITLKMYTDDGYVIDAAEWYINGIGTVEYTDDCKARIDAARAAYDALTDAQRALVANADTLVAAEAAYAALAPAPVDPDPVVPAPAPCYVVVNEGDITEPYAAEKAVTLMGAVYDGCDVVGIVELKLGKVNAKKGASKVSGSVTTLDGKKHAAKGVNVDGIDGTAPATVSLEVKGLGTMAVTIGGTQFAGSLGGTYHVQSADVGGAWAGGSAVAAVEPGDLAVFAGTVLSDLLPTNEVAAVSGGKWKFKKAASVKWAKPKKGAALPEIYDAASGKGLVVDTSKGTNLSGLKLTYTPKKGTFKGTFNVYALEGSGAATKLKKYKLSVSGVVVGGAGYGVAMCKKPALQWPMTVK